MSVTLSLLVGELDAEAPITRRVLDRIPAERLAWRPHAKSMTLGQLGMHVATIPERLSTLSREDGFDAAKANFQPPQPESLAQILGAHDAGLDAARANIAGFTPEDLRAPWRLTFGDRELFAIPRAGMLRTLLFNHWIHHRGQLSVYLRLLEVPLPVIYGRSADENPFA
jgi:uncharacterized damage-inducible protein DinB